MRLSVLQLLLAVTVFACILLFAMLGLPLHCSLPTQLLLVHMLARQG
jgi:hypothetical protein